MDIGALLFQLQFPNEVGVPILYSTMAGSRCSFNNSRCTCA